MRQFLDSCKLLWQPLVITATVYVAWLLSAPMRLGFVADVGALTSGTIPILAIAYAIIAGLLLQKVILEWFELEHAARTENKPKFLEYVHRQLPTTVYMLLWIISSAPIGAFFLVSFSSLVTGSFSIIVITFVITTVNATITDLDDYFSGVWNIDINTLPKEWRDELKK